MEFCPQLYSWQPFDSRHEHDNGQPHFNNNSSPGDYEMEAEYNHGNSALQPTNIHYNAVLNAYARSPRADKALKAAGFLKIMQNHESPRCLPDIISYNSLLLACANAFGNDELKHKSFQIAIQAFKDALTNGNSSIQPTSTTFAHFCKASRRLPPPQQQKTILGKALKLCCDKGLLNQVVIQQCFSACKTEEEWKEMAGGISQQIGFRENLQTSQVAKSWICNSRR